MHLLPILLLTKNQKQDENKWYYNIKSNNDSPKIITQYTGSLGSVYSDMLMYMHPYINKFVDDNRNDPIKLSRLRIIDKTSDLIGHVEYLNRFEYNAGYHFTASRTDNIALVVDCSLSKITGNSNFQNGLYMTANGISFSDVSSASITGITFYLIG